MGRLLSEKEIIHTNIDSYLDKSTSEYSRFLEGTPTFVIYYNKNKLRSTVDEGLENVQKHMAQASPKIYDRINDLPLYGIDAASLELDREDLGLETKLQGDAIILPGTIKPLPNDFFTIEYLSDTYLFRVNSARNDKLRGEQFYTIEYSLYKKLKKGEQFQLNGEISDEFQVLFDRIGTDKKAILKQQESVDLQAIESIYDKLLDFYTENFYVPQFDIFAYEISNGQLLYNQLATNIMSANNLFKRKREFLNSISVNDILKKDTSYYMRYKYSIYSALEKQDVEELEGLFIRPLKINQPHTPFYFQRVTVYDTYFTNEINDEGIIEVFDNNFIKNIKSNLLYESNMIENIVIKFINKDEELITMDDILQFNKNIYLQNNVYYFIMIPLILYIFNHIKNKLISSISI